MKGHEDEDAFMCNDEEPTGMMHQGLNKGACKAQAQALNTSWHLHAPRFTAVDLSCARSSLFIDPESPAALDVVHALSVPDIY